MKKFKFTIALGVFFLFGCGQNIVTANGRIPAQYVKQAGAVQGHYLGNFAGYSGSVRISLYGDLPVLNFTGDFKNFLNKCGASVGQLKSIRVGGSAKNGYLSQAVFGYDGNNCDFHDDFILSFQEGSHGAELVGRFHDRHSRSDLIDTIGMPGL
jgi:hypothetical protein